MSYQWKVLDDAMDWLCDPAASSGRERVRFALSRLMPGDLRWFRDPEIREHIRAIDRLMGEDVYYPDRVNELSIEQLRQVVSHIRLAHSRAIRLDERTAKAEQVG